MTWQGWLDDFKSNRSLHRWLGFAIAVFILILTLYLSYSFAESLQAQERNKMESFGLAFKQLQKEDISQETRDILLQIINKNEDIPMVRLDEYDEILGSKNLNINKIDSARLVKEMKEANGPIKVNLPWGEQYIYYKNSALSIKLKYYPAVLLLIIFIFSFVSWLYFKALKNTEQSYLWVGMAKETAHQIGTPLSSIMGWMELIKLGETDESTFYEVDKDIARLDNIAKRFSKIGSEPELGNHDIVQVVSQNFYYLKTRVSKNLHFELSVPHEPLEVLCSPLLLGWVIENLLKNAVDALQNRGHVKLTLENQVQNVKITVQDNGPGIPFRFQKRIFDPGYTTKKRGWGLGLSLAKRIIQEYHNGKIWVEKSDKDNGTCISITIPKSSSK